MNPGRSNLRATTVLGIVRDGRGAMACDGQVTAGDRIIKLRARKIRVLAGGTALAGFAGGGADALQLFEQFETSLESHRGNLLRAAVEVARAWRTDRALRRLDAQLLVMDRQRILAVSGSGDLLEPDDGALAVGSGGGYALAAARAMLRTTDLPLERIVEDSIRIAAEICVYTGGDIVVESLATGA